jgi:hypothetical protein
VLECLAERTIALAQLRKLADPAGYDPLLERRMRSLLVPAKRNGAHRHQHGRRQSARGRAQVVALARELGGGGEGAVVAATTCSPLAPNMKTIESRGAPLASTESW